EAYTVRALENGLHRGRLFADLTPDQRRAVAGFLLGTGRLEFRRVDAGQTIVAEGDPASGFYLVRLGTVRVFQTVGGQERVLAGAGGGATPPPGVLGEYVELGLYQGQRLLALDLVKCTRCDECTKACADSHDGTARLLREGLRFGDFLVATSCRSCHKPYCM